MNHNFDNVSLKISNLTKKINVPSNINREKAISEGNRNRKKTVEDDKSKNKTKNKTDCRFTKKGYFCYFN